MVEKVEHTRYYETGEIIEHKRQNLKDKYLDGEITAEEYREYMPQMTTEDELAQDIEDMKAEQYAELQEQFEDDEITDEELEAEMDRLFESGDEFLDVNPDARDMGETVDEVKFQARQIGEIVALVVGVALFALVSLFTAGRGTLPMLLIIMVLYLAWSRFK